MQIKQKEQRRRGLDSGPRGPGLDIGNESNSGTGCKLIVTRVGLAKRSEGIFSHCAAAGDRTQTGARGQPEGRRAII